MDPVIYIRDGQTYILTDEGVEVVPRDGDKDAIAKAAGRRRFDSEDWLREHREAQYRHPSTRKPTPTQEDKQERAAQYYKELLREAQSTDRDYMDEANQNWVNWLGKGGW